MKKFLKNVSWPLAYSFSPKILQGLKFIVLIRLLGPFEFGIYAFALVWIAIAEGLSEFGVRQAIIQQKIDPVEQEGKALNTVLLFRGILIALGLTLLAWVLRNWTAKIDPLSILAISFIPLFRGLYSVCLANTLRNLNYKRMFFFETSWRSLDLVLIIFALYLVDNSSRAAIITTSISELSAVFFSFFILNNYIRFSADFLPIKPLIRYGRWIWGQSIMTVILNQFDKVYVITLFGSTAMGAYQGVNRLMQMVIADPINMLVGVWFPKLAIDIRKNETKAWVMFCEILKAYLIAMCICVVFTVAFRSEIIRFMFGTEWIEFSKFTPIFSMTMAIGGLITLLVAWFRCIGSPQWVTLSTFVQFIVYITFIVFIGKLYGAFGVALSVLSAGFSSLVVLIISLGRERSLKIILSKEIICCILGLFISIYSIHDCSNWVNFVVVYLLVLLSLLWVRAKQIFGMINE